MHKDKEIIPDTEVLSSDNDFQDITESIVAETKEAVVQPVVNQTINKMEESRQLTKLEWVLIFLIGALVGIIICMLIF